MANYCAPGQLIGSGNLGERPSPEDLPLILRQIQGSANEKNQSKFSRNLINPNFFLGGGNGIRQSGLKSLPKPSSTA